MYRAALVLISAGRKMSMVYYMQERMKDAMREMMGEGVPLVYFSDQGDSASSGTGYGYKSSTNSGTYTRGGNQYVGFGQTHTKKNRTEIWGKLQFFICIALVLWIAKMIIDHGNIFVALTFVSRMMKYWGMEQFIFFVEWTGILLFSLLGMYLLSRKWEKYFKIRILAGLIWFALGLEMCMSAAICRDVEVINCYALSGIIFWITAIVMLSKCKVSSKK